jgi:alkaline phosphatase
MAKKISGNYVDGFVLVVQKSKLAAYRKMATMGRNMWMKYGALDYKECVGDDMNIKGVVAFPKAVKAKPGEIVVFSYIVFKSRAHRDAVNKKVMKDPTMNDPKYANMPMPFDMKRMCYGGFKVIVSS